MPKAVKGVPADVLFPELAWKDRAALDAGVNMLAKSFINNFEQFHDRATAEVIAAGPVL